MIREDTSTLRKNQSLSRVRKTFCEVIGDCGGNDQPWCAAFHARVDGIRFDIDRSDHLRVHVHLADLTTGWHPIRSGDCRIHPACVEEMSKALLDDIDPGDPVVGQVTEPDNEINSCDEMFGSVKPIRLFPGAVRS